LYRRDLDLVAAAPNGDIASFGGVWYDDVTRSADIEPVGTYGPYQRRGLARAVMLEGLRRVKRLGATLALVGGYTPAANALYASVMGPDHTLSQRWVLDLTAKTPDPHHTDVRALKRSKGGIFMETLEAIRTRRSTRAFLPKPVPQEILAQVLDVSRWAPSGGNRQGWRVTVAAGERCATLAERLAEAARERGTEMSGSRGPLWDDLEQIAESMGLSLWEFIFLGSYRLYGAPAVIVVSNLGQGRGSVSHFVTTMLLAAHDLGLGTCWLGYPLSHAGLIRETLDIPEEERIGAVVAIGYPDPDSPANAFRSPRDELETIARWVGFE
jgi:nitroreductase